LLAVPGVSSAGGGIRIKAPRKNDTGCLFFPHSPQMHPVVSFAFCLGNIKSLDELMHPWLPNSAPSTPKSLAKFMHALGCICIMDI
jgi:hypothetical protein